jgi:glucose-1-phosphate thymidylyltransferase
MERIEQAIILAAGEGQRLRPFTAFAPKVMLSIAGKPMLEYVIEALAQNGIRRIVMVVGYHKEQVQDYFSSGRDFGVEINYITQERQLGTANALWQARDAADERFLVLSGDNIVDSDTIAPIVDAKDLTIMVKKQEDASKYGVVIVREGLVKNIAEKPSEPMDNTVNIGIYAFNRDIFDFVKDEINLTDALRKMAIQGYSIITGETDGTWLDVVYPWDILRLNGSILSKTSRSLAGTIETGCTIKGEVSVGERSIIRSNCYIVGPVIIGKGCEIGPGVYILPSTTIGDDVIISPFSLLRNSVIGYGVTIGPNASLQDSIIAPDSIIGGHFIARSGEALVAVEGEYHRMKMGGMMGSYCELEDNVLVEPGVIIGNHCRIKASKVVGENMVDGSLVV